MADDINDHREEMKPLENNTYLNIFKAVVSTNYLPRMTHKESLWVMVVSKNHVRQEVVEYYMGKDKYNIIENELLDNMDTLVEFVYYSRGRQ